MATTTTTRKRKAESGKPKPANPAKRSRKPKAAATPPADPQPSTLNDQPSWECPNCRESNDRPAPSCKGCMQERPGLDDREAMLCFALEPHDEAQGYWDEFRTLGATDTAIRERARAILADQLPMQHARSDRGFLCWQVEEELDSHAAGSIRVWFGEDEPPDRAPDLEGDAFIAAVRDLFGIETVVAVPKEPLLPDVVVNDFHVVTFGFQTIDVTFPKTAKCEARIEYCETHDRVWRFATTLNREWGKDRGYRGDSIRIDRGPTFDCEAECVLAAWLRLDAELRDCWKQQLTPANDKRLRSALKAIEPHVNAARAAVVKLDRATADTSPLSTLDSPLSTEHTGMLRSILEPDRASAEAWAELRGVPTDDDRLASRIHEVLRNRPSRESTLWGPVCWGPDADAAVIGAMAVWFDDSAPTGRAADLQGPALLAAVRGLYGIPDGKRTPPATAESGKPKQNGKIPKAVPPPAETLVSPLSSLPSNGPTVRNLDPATIDRFPLNPRDEAEFDDASLKELGGELKRRQVQSCVVREVAGPDGVKRFQLIAGERRWRAAKLVGLAELRCEIVDVDDAEAIWMCGAENESRQNWSPIAQARWYVELKKAEGLTDRQLAKRVGRSQPVVTSAMNLLSLPEAWRRRLISREISPTVARPLLPWANKRPQVLEKVESLLQLDKRDADDGPLTVRKVEDAVRSAVRSCTKSMNPAAYIADAPLFSITKKRREELDCEKLKIDGWHGATPTLRAWNVELWNTLQKEAKAKRKKEGKSTSKSRHQVYMPREYTEEWVLQRLLRNWQNDLIAARWPEKDVDLALRIYVVGQTAVDREIFGMIQGKKWPRHSRVDWGDTQQLSMAKFTELLPTAVQAAFNNDAKLTGDTRRTFAQELDDAANELCRQLKIDVAAQWQPTREQLECFCLDDLRKFKGLPKGERTAKKLSKAELIEHFLEHWPAGWMPPAVRKILGVKNKPRARQS